MVARRKGKRKESVHSHKQKGAERIYLRTRRYWEERIFAENMMETWPGLAIMAVGIFTYRGSSEPEGGRRGRK